MASAAFVSSTVLSETILDLARVDALSLCCILASLACARHAAASAQRRTVTLWLASGALMGLAILAKQTATAPAVMLFVVAALSVATRGVRSRSSAARRRRSRSRLCYWSPSTAPGRPFILWSYRVGTC